MSMNRPTILTQQTLERVGETEVKISRSRGKPLLLLVRMASRGMGVWDTSWDYLAEYFTVAQFDLKMPSSDEMGDPASVFLGLAQDCVRIAQGLGFDRFHLLGWTGGAHVGLSCAVKFPRQLASLTLVAPFSRLPDARALSVASEFMAVLMEHGGRELYAYYWFLAGFSPAFVRRNFSEIERMVGARLDGDRFIKTNADNASQWSRVLRTFSLTDEELAAIKVPTLIIGPELDPAHIGPNAEMAEALHKRIAGSELVIGTGYGSLMLLEAPEAFQAASRSFFKTVTNKQV